MPDTAPSSEAAIAAQIFIAHVHPLTKSIQTLQTHLQETRAHAGAAAAKIGLRHAGELLGLMHDFGKFSAEFQRYIRHVTALPAAQAQQIDQDADASAASSDEPYNPQRGDVDHSTAGAQWVYGRFLQHNAKDPQQDQRMVLIGQMLSVCIASHHSGLIDVLDDQINHHHALNRRLCKDEQASHKLACVAVADPDLLAQARQLSGASLINELRPLLQRIRDKNLSDQPEQNLIQEFYHGCLTRFLFSALIDGDRISSADFEFPHQAALRSTDLPDWSQAIGRLEDHLCRLNADTAADDAVGLLRRDISDHCLQRACDAQGIYTLTVPTGGGKTLASLRHALHHAAQHGLDRVIFIIPFTSIIDQNAAEVRAILGDQRNGQSWVLEHHSNLEPSRYSWQTKLHTDNWDSPVIFTTMVQYLESWFGSGTRSVRRLHQLARAVLVFDEIQTLPVRAIRLFVNSLNFLSEYAHTTAVLCTATQPVLHALPCPEYGQIHLQQPHGELMSGWRGQVQAVDILYGLLQRVDILPQLQPGGWSQAQITDFVEQQFHCSGSVLVIVNTKAWAKTLYQDAKAAGLDPQAIFHLSTAQCPAHRKDTLARIRQRLHAGLPTLCISTQLIEAGVNVSFATVIRFLAGLDSIAQAAGRCNRHGELRDAHGKPRRGQVHILNPAQENLTHLPDIAIGRAVSLRVIEEFPRERLLSPTTLESYYRYYLKDRNDELAYPLADRDSSILLLLAHNPTNPYPAKNLHRAKGCYPLLQQSFKTAYSAFKAIDTPTEAILVPYDQQAQDVISQLNRDPHADPAAYFNALRAAQQYSVNVFPHVWQRLTQQDGVVTPLPQQGIYVLDERFYSAEFGLDLQGQSTLEALIF